MSAGELILAPEAIDLDHVIADITEIRKFNPQRFELEQLTAVVYDDPETQTVAGYKDLSENEFWCRGHLPGMPLMPGVLMCEAAAQLCSYHAHSHGLTHGKILGFGGLDGVRFRGVVKAPNRLVLVAKILKIRHGLMIVYKFECFVDKALVCDGELRGIGLPGTEALPRHQVESA